MMWLCGYVHRNFTSSKPLNMIQQVTCVRQVQRSIEVCSMNIFNGMTATEIHISGSDASMRRMAAEAPCFKSRYLESYTLKLWGCHWCVRIIGFWCHVGTFGLARCWTLGKVLVKTISFAVPGTRVCMTCYPCCIRNTERHPATRFFLQNGSLWLEGCPLLVLMNASLADQMQQLEYCIDSIDSYWPMLKWFFSETVPESLALQGARPSQPPALCLFWQVFFFRGRL